MVSHWAVGCLPGVGIADPVPRKRIKKSLAIGQKYKSPTGG